MGLPDIHCVVCGGPFGNPYEELKGGRYPDAGPVDHITIEELQVWNVVHKMQYSS